MSSPSTASKGKSAVLCQAATAFKKKPGQLSLNRTHLVWALQGSDRADGELSFDVRRLNSLFMSKEGGAKVVLKVGVLDVIGGNNEESYNFTFTAGASAVSDREHFKREISQMIAQNRADAATAADVSAAPRAAANGNLNGASSAGPSQQFNGLPTPAEVAAAADLMLQKDGDASSSTAGVVAASAPAVDPTKDWAVRQRLLKQNAELRQLHVELVRTGHITEEEFWEGREHLLVAEALQYSQIQGRNAQLVDPKPEQGENGEIKIKLSQQLIKDIFEQYPIVTKIYNDNVPEPLAEGEFWHRYFHSKLFDRHRASGRSTLGSASAGTAKDDPIFDKYLLDEDDDLEPRNPSSRTEDVYKLLDLAATEEDHQETGNFKDFTMRAGSQKRSLPLMRRFNEHSERLLEQAMGSQEAKNKNLGHVHGGNAGLRRYYDDIVLDDLQGDVQEENIPLDVRERDSLFEGMSTSESDGPAKKRKRLSSEEEEEIFRERQEMSSSWRPDLARFAMSVSEAQLALRSLQSNISSRISNSASSSIANSKLFPEQVLRSMISCQASANEFLRHFWSAVLPAAAGDISASAMANPQQKAAKATRMIDYLRKTQERIDTVVKEGEKAGADGNSVREALQPCQQAVRKAIKYFADKVGK